MKTILTAIALMCVISANAGVASAHDDDKQKSYEQHESRDHGERYKRDDDDNENSNQHHLANRDNNHAINRGGGHSGAGTESNE